MSERILSKDATTERYQACFYQTTGKKQIELHDGPTDVKSKPGKGSGFIIGLPYE